MTPGFEYSRREQRGWYFYDFANSAFASTVLTLLLGPYIVGIAKAGAGPDGLIRVVGVPIEPRSWWSYLVAGSVVLQVIVLPLVGAVADASPRKKQMLALWAYSGALATMALFFVTGTAYLLGGILFLFANVVFGASIVVYNAFLPVIAAPDERDAVSSKGWGLGYLGGGLALALNLLLFAKAGALGISESLAARINLASAGVWWAVFTIIPMLTLRNRAPVITSTEHIHGAFSQLFRTVAGMRAYPQTLTFLVAYLLYNDAVQAVIALSGQFGADELKIPMGTLALAILMVQFVAFGGALAFNWVAEAIGTKPAIIVSLLIWTGALVSIYVSIRTTGQFFIMAAIIAIVLGGTQALSRSLFSQMIPKGKEAEYFSLYEISDKGTSWMAPLFFGLALQFTGNYRLAILSLIVFFAAGLAILLRIDVARATAEAAANVPQMPGVPRVQSAPLP
jgi:UMF1 family MFS transporter